MRHGFVKVCTITPKLRVADPEYNKGEIIKRYQEAKENGARIIVFPELCITGYTCQDLFHHDLLLKKSLEVLEEIKDVTEDSDELLFVGLPFENNRKLYNVAAVIQDGKVLALIPKTRIPNYNEFYEIRHFQPGTKKLETVLLFDEEVPFGPNQLFTFKEFPELTLACELCEDLWVPDSPGTEHALAGATVLVNLSASNETIGKSDYRKMLVASTSARLVCAYLYSSAGISESTQDLVFSGHDLISENGTILAESKRFCDGILYADLDVFFLSHERRKMNTFPEQGSRDYKVHVLEMESYETRLERKFSATPFVPTDPDKRGKRCEEILSIQAYGLMKRLEHTQCTTAVVGLSGGLDSTLALLVTIRAFDLLGLERKGILAVTMPCFGTTDRTYDNACELAEQLGTTLLKIDIKDVVLKHFQDIGQDPRCHDVTYENGQARERTQVLMNLANKHSGLVIGTGDMSELALGWATYNGDHMSMYGVNSGVPKTLVRHLVQYVADEGNETLRAILIDILETPVSPELLPPVEGTISQITEDIVGPYELHDFFLYFMLRMGYSPDKIFRIAKETFRDQFEEEIIKKWLKIFHKRFFSQQFKRSCLPDGPKVGSVAVSPRGDLRMPSDASSALWMKCIDEL